jgi:hypothetical protein
MTFFDLRADNRSGEPPTCGAGNFNVEAMHRSHMDLS